MSTALLVLGCVVAVVNVPSSAGLLAWGLLGGDGEPDRGSDVVLAALVVVGALYAVWLSFRAFAGVSPVLWRLAWGAPAAALLSLIIVGRREREPLAELAKALWMPSALALPPGLIWLAGAVAA